MKPAISFAAIAGRRRSTLDLAQEIERRGFSGLSARASATAWESAKRLRW